MYYTHRTQVLCKLFQRNPVKSGFPKRICTKPESAWYNIIKHIVMINKLFIPRNEGYSASDLNKFESLLGIRLPVGYLDFLSIFHSMNCTLQLTQKSKNSEIEFYFGEEVFIEEFYSLEKMQEIYLEYKFFDLDLVHHSKILIIGEFFGGHEFIRIGFGENNYNNMFWIESSEWPDLGDKDNWDFNTMSKYWYDFGITFEEFIARLECK